MRIGFSSWVKLTRIDIQEQGDLPNSFAIRFESQTPPGFEMRPDRLDKSAKGIRAPLVLDILGPTLGRICLKANLPEITVSVFGIGRERQVRLEHLVLGRVRTSDDGFGKPSSR